MSSGVGYTLQIIAQKNTEPAVASLLMSLESVFAALAGWVLLNQKFSGREMLGCAIMFAAIVLAQLRPYCRGKEEKGQGRVGGAAHNFGQTPVNSSSLNEPPQ